LTCTYLAKRLRELSSTKTGSYPHEFLCRTNCSACADYQPWYIGETKGSLNTRMCGHRSGINNNQYHEVYHHFRQQDHSNLYASFHLGNNFNLSTPLRRQKEEYWMCESWELQCHTSAMWKVWMSSTKAISYTINLLELWFHLFSKINMFLSFHIHMFPPLHPKS
jgi:hypothetical protein